MLNKNTQSPRFVVLSGGVGGAKLVAGLSDVLTPDDVMILANTGDDFRHLGLHISPDLDTLMYTLAGIANPETGWGQRDESWNFMDSLTQLHGEDWFRLGDKDLATHIERTRMLAEGQSLAAATANLCQALQVEYPIVPMSNDPVATMLQTDQGHLAFQDYFVRLQARPKVSAIEFVGAESARPAPQILEALQNPALEGIIITPSNPYLSIGPILSLAAIRAAIENSVAPVLAVSPIVGGEAIKGPTAKLMREHGVECSALGVAKHYHGLIDGLLVDECDGDLIADIENEGIRAFGVPSIMRTRADKTQLAEHVLTIAVQLNKQTTN